MRIHLLVAGKLRPGPEKSLFEDYLERFARLGRSVGIGPTVVKEWNSVGKGRDMPLWHLAGFPSSAVCVLDERGCQLSSPEFANFLSEWRDVGVRDAAFVIGGPEGVDISKLAKGSFVLSLSKMVFPHLFARIMLVEQLYRAATILNGTPYHKS